MLKLLPLYSTVLTKIAIVSLSSILTGTFLVYGHRSRIFKRYKLYFGVVFLLVSHNFLNISSTIKQDSLSIPLLLLFLAVALHLLADRAEPKARHLILAHLIVLLLLGLGYVAYMQALLVLVVATFVQRKQRLPLLLIAAQLAVLFLYLRVWGVEQIITNKDRFAWVAEYHNSLIQALSIHLSGLLPLNYFSETLVIASFILITLSLYKTFRNPSKLHFRFLVLLLSVALIVVAYVTQSFVRIRYNFLLFILISLTMGWGLPEFSSKNKYLLMVPVPFFCIALMGTTLRQAYLSEWAGERLKVYKEISTQNEAYGVLDANDGLHVFAFKSKHSLSENVVPINLYYPKLYERHMTIDYKVLALQGKRPYVLDERKISELLAENELKNFFYIIELEDTMRYPAGSPLVLSVLQNSCRDQQTMESLESLVFVFRNCEFDNEK